MPKFTGSSLTVDTINFTDGTTPLHVVNTKFDYIGVSGSAFMSYEGGWDTIAYSANPLAVTLTDLKSGDIVIVEGSIGAYCTTSIGNTAGVRIYDGASAVYGTTCLFPSRDAGSTFLWFNPIGQIDIAGTLASLTLTAQTISSGDMVDIELYGEASLVAYHFRPF